MYYALIVPTTGDVVMYLPAVHYRWLGSKPLPGQPHKRALAVGETSKYSFRSTEGAVILLVKRIEREEFHVGF